MNAIHCHTCGGFIGDARAIAYRLPSDPGRVAVPSSALCECAVPVVYGPPPGHHSSPGFPAMASRGGTPSGQGSR